MEAAVVKGCLVVVGCVLVAALAVVGVVVGVQRSGDAEDADLTLQASRVEVVSAEPETRGTPPNRVVGAVVAYAYEADGRRFASSTWLPNRAREGGGPVVCVDATDPAVHTVRTNARVACGDGPLGSDGVRRADPVTS